MRPLVQLFESSRAKKKFGTMPAGSKETMQFVEALESRQLLASVFASSTTNVNIPDNGGFVSSPITVSSAPSGAAVTAVDVSFRAVHGFSGDLYVDLNADAQGSLGNVRIWNREGAGADNPTRSLNGVSTYNGLSVNRTWYLYAKDSATGDVGYIDEWSIRVHYSDVVTPSVPVQTAPASNANVAGPSVTFRWNQSSNATGYELYVRDLTTDVLSTYPINGAATTQHTLTLIQGRRYRWNMRAVNGALQSATSTAWEFNVQTGPDVPAHTAPTNNATVTGPSVMFRWNQSSNATGYELYVRDLTTDVLSTYPISGAATTQHTLTLIQGRRYRWNMRAVNGAVQSATSSAWEFNVATLPNTRPDPSTAPGIRFSLPLAVDSPAHYYFDRNPNTNAVLAWNGITTDGISGGAYDGHRGTDFSGLQKNTPVYAAAGGTLVEKDDGHADFAGPPNGNYVRINHGNDSTGTPIISVYLHLNAGSVTSKPIGAWVDAREHIGGVGTSGDSTGLHLHFETQRGTPPNRLAFDPYAAAGETSWWAEALPGTPSITSFAPVSPSVQATRQRFDIYGADFAAGATIRLRNPQSTDPGPFDFSLTQRSDRYHHVSSSHIWIEPILSAVGEWSLQVINNLGGSNEQFSETKVFTVSPNVTHGAVDAENLGKGDWIWRLPNAMTSAGTATLAEFVAYEASLGMDWITVKAGDANEYDNWANLNQVSSALVDLAHAAGMKVFWWVYVYGGASTGNPNHLSTVDGEIAVALQALANGGDGLIINAEAEYESLGSATAASAATSYMRALRAAYPDTFMAHAPFAVVNAHPAFPYAEFGKYVDAVMPQAYWSVMGPGGNGITPAAMVDRLNLEWSNAHAAWAAQGHGDSVKPIAPIGWGAEPATAVEIVQFVDLLKAVGSPPHPAGYRGVSFWSAQNHTAELWQAIGTISIGSKGIVGDANADGKIDADDYFRIDQGFLAQPLNPTYVQGDFNYDGRINADDYFLIDRAFLSQGISLSSPIAPAPSFSTAPITVAEEPKRSWSRSVRLDVPQLERRRVRVGSRQ